jgi:transcriptional regulator with XRE-family HTH domain
MARIIPEVLKRLREERGWSLDQLADRTKPKVNRQTIYRIEKGKQRNSRANTVLQLARALNTAPTVLTGESAVPDKPDTDSRISMMSKLGFRISNSAHNAMYLVSERFNVTHSEIVELAPFLFCWAAEASLQRRREYLKQVEIACEHARQLEGAIKHLVAPDLSASEEKIAAEKKSIDEEDLFGLSLEFHAVHDDWTNNPFSLFLDSLAEDLDEEETFDGYMFRDFPSYRVCTKLAATYANGDAELAEQILDGQVILNDMPDDVREKWAERAQWVREQVQEFRKEVLSRHV